MHVRLFRRPEPLLLLQHGHRDLLSSISVLIAFALTGAILTVLVTAGVGKISSVRSGSSGLGSSVAALWPLRRAPSAALAESLGRTVIVAEWAVVALLAVGLVVLVTVLTPVVILVGCGLGFVLFAIFAGSEALALRRGQRPLCACFGARSHPVSVPGTLRTAALALFAAIALGLMLFPSVLWLPSARDTVLALLLGVVGGAALAGVDDIVQALRPLPSSTRSS